MRLCTEQRRSTVDALEATRTADRLMVAVDDAFARFDREMSQLPPWKLDCKPGCAWCCHGSVQTSAPEVLRIATYLRAIGRPSRFAAIKQRVDALDSQARVAPAGPAVARLPCPLLAGNRCSVYPVRPLACRGWNSANSERCREDLLGTLRGSVPVRRLQLALQAVISTGFDEGLSRLGLRTQVLALTPALRIALAGQLTAECWMAGEPCFEVALWT